MAAKSKLFLKVYTRRGIIFDQEVKSVSALNDTGKFDVLAEHAQFISLIQDKMEVRTPDGSDQQIPVHSAVMRVKGDTIEVFLGVKQ